MSREFPAFHPVGNREMAGGTIRKVHNSKSGGLLIVFFEQDNGCVGTVAGELGDFSQGELVSVAVCRAGYIGAVREERTEEIGFIV